MKKAFKYLSAAVLALFAFSCTEKETPYVPGEAENSNPYNVFFEKLDNSAFQYDPSDPTEISFIAYRDSNSVANELKVPVVLTPNAGSESIFTPSELVFEKDSVWAEIKLTFPNAEVGTVYGATLAVTDPEFIHKYSSYPKSLSFTVQRVKWNNLGKGKYYDDLMAYWSKVDYDPVEVDFLQCDTDPGLFRIADPYTVILKAIGATPAETPSKYVEIRALKKGEKVGTIASSLSNAVYFEETATGYQHPSYGLPIVLLHPINFEAGKDPAYWSHSQVVSYQENGLPGEIHLAPYYYMYGLGGFNYSQYDDDIDIIFPGYVPTDYTIYLESDYPSDGVTPVYMEVGEDIASVKYAIYEGTMGEGGAKKKVESITNGTDPSTTFSDFEYDEDEDVRYAFFDVSPAATGLYTLVAVGYDAEGEAQNVGFLNFEFIAAEDEKEFAVKVTLGTEETSARYEEAGHNKMNSFSYWIAGKDLTEVHVGVFKKETFDKDPEAAASAVKYSAEALGEEELAQINSDGGYATLATGLNALTDYIVVVWATNGKLDDFFTASFTTEGLPLELVTEGTFVYNVWWEAEDATSLFWDPNTEEYVIPDWGGGVDFRFTVDDKGIITIPPFFIGYVHASYGNVYYMECADYYEEPDDKQKVRSYIGEDGIYYFHPIVFVSAGYFGDGWEKFVPTETLPGKVSARAKKLNANFNGKSVNTNNCVLRSFPEEISIAVERSYVPVNAVVKVNTEKGARVRVRSNELEK